MSRPLRIPVPLDRPDDAAELAEATGGTLELAADGSGWVVVVPPGPMAECLRAATSPEHLWTTDAPVVGQE